MLRLGRGAGILSLQRGAGISNLDAVRRRCLCGVTDAQTSELEDFLKNASRPKMGKAKAKQSAGQRELDLTKQLSRLGGTPLTDLLRMDSAALKEQGASMLCDLTFTLLSPLTRNHRATRRRAVPGTETHDEVCRQDETGLDV